MQIEFEAKFLNVDKDKVRSQLKKIGAKMVYPEFLMKRVTFDPPIDIPGGWLRVRQEPNKVTMTLKAVTGNKISDQREINLEVNSAEEAIKFLSEIGAKRKSRQETLRELWLLDGVEITIDTWPGVPTFVEVEGKDEQSIKIVAEKLGFDYTKALFGSLVDICKKEFGMTHEEVDSLEEITFEHPIVPPKR